MTGARRGCPRRSANSATGPGGRPGGTQGLVAGLGLPGVAGTRGQGRANPGHHRASGRGPGPLPFQPRFESLLHHSQSIVKKATAMPSALKRRRSVNPVLVKDLRQAGVCHPPTTGSRHAVIVTTAGPRLVIISPRIDPVPDTRIRRWCPVCGAGVPPAAGRQAGRLHHKPDRVTGPVYQGTAEVSTRITRTSMTLVCVSPVLSRSPVASKKVVGVVPVQEIAPAPGRARPRFAALPASADGAGRVGRAVLAVGAAAEARPRRASPPRPAWPASPARIPGCVRPGRGPAPASPSSRRRESRHTGGRHGCPSARMLRTTPASAIATWRVSPSMNEPRLSTR